MESCCAAELLCESCRTNEANDLHTCPYRLAKYCNGPDEIQDQLCNCCDECTALCKEKS